jgi:hypothetical protein
MNTFSLKFINQKRFCRQFRKYTTCAQRFINVDIYEPVFWVILSSDGKDWSKVLDDLVATLGNASFYRDAPDRAVEFSITFDFGYSDLPIQQKSDFMDRAKLILNSDPTGS